MSDTIDIDTIQDPTLRQQILAAKAKLGGATPGAPKTPGVTPNQTADEGMMGFGKVNKELLANSAGGMDDKIAFGLMNSGTDNLAGGGGLIAQKSPFAAAADGLKQGLGTYGMLSTMKSKRDTAAALGDILSPKAKSKALRSASTDFPLTQDGELAIDP